MSRVITVQARRELVEAVRSRYQSADRHGKTLGSRGASSTSSSHPSSSGRSSGSAPARSSATIRRQRPARGSWHRRRSRRRSRRDSSTSPRRSTPCDSWTRSVACNTNWCSSLRAGSRTRRIRCRRRRMICRAFLRACRPPGALAKYGRRTGRLLSRAAAGAPASIPSSRRGRQLPSGRNRTLSARPLSFSSACGTKTQVSTATGSYERCSDESRHGVPRGHGG